MATPTTPTAHYRYYLPTGHLLELDIIEPDACDADAEPLVFDEQPANSSHPRSTKVKAFFQGTAAGALTGLLCVYSDRARFPLFPANWLACSLFRVVLVDALADKELASATHAYTLSTAAWLADWITYIMIKFRRQ